MVNRDGEREREREREREKESNESLQSVYLNDENDDFSIM